MSLFANPISWGPSTVSQHCPQSIPDSNSESFRPRKSSMSWPLRNWMVICLDKDTLSCLTCRRKIERVLWVIWIELGLSGEFHGVELSCIIYTRKSVPVRDRIFENFRKSKYRSKFLIWFLGITHQRVSLEKLWAIRKNWRCPEILDGYRKSLLILWPTKSFNVVFP